MTLENATTPRGNRLWFLAVLGLALGAVVGIARYRAAATYHLATVQKGVLYRDGARSAHELENAVNRVHANTVVCLVDDQEMSDPNKPQFQEEMNWLRSHGFRAERVPVKLGGWPSSADVRRFLDLATDKKSQPVLVHCAQGVRRTAMMVAAYQESVLGYDKEKAKAAILSFGHSDRTINDIRRFIDEYDPKSRTVSPQLATVEVKAEK